MAGTVTSNLTRITGAEVADDAAWEDIGSGPGNVNSAEIFIQGSEAQARRMSNQEKGLSFDNTTGIDLSAADTLIGWWVQCLQPSQLGTSTNQDLEVRVTSNTSPTTSADGWDVLDSSNYPALGGFVRVWVAVNEITPDRSGSPTYTSLRHFGINAHIGTVAGNAPNLICDAIDYLDGGGAALVIDAGTGGSPATFADLLAADEGSTTNKYGVWQSRSGVLYCAVRTQIADATLTVFNDSGFVVVFPLQTGTASQNLINNDSNGITIDLQTSGTDIDWADGVIRSEDSTNTPGDLQVTGTTGAFDATGMRLEGLRIVTLTSACSITASVFFECGLVTADGADLGENIFQLGTGAVAVGWDTATNPGSTGGELDNTTFISDGTGHGIEFGTTSPLTIDLNDVTFTGYAGSDGSTGNESIWFRRSSGTVTLNINGGTNPSVRTDGAVINKVINPVTFAVNVKALDDASNLQDANVIVRPLDGTGPLPFEDAVTITRVDNVATVAHTAHGMNTSSGDPRLTDRTLLEFTGGPGGVEFTADFDNMVMVGPFYDPDGADSQGYHIATYDPSGGDLHIWRSSNWNGPYAHLANNTPTGTIQHITAGLVTRTDLANTPYVIFAWTEHSGSSTVTRARTWRTGGGTSGTWGTEYTVYTATNTVSHPVFIAVEDNTVFCVHPWDGEDNGGTDYRRPGVSFIPVNSPNNSWTNDSGSLITGNPASHREATFAMGDRGVNGTIIVGLEDGGSNDDAIRVTESGSAITKGTAESGDFPVGTGSLVSQNAAGEHNGGAGEGNDVTAFLGTSGGQVNRYSVDLQVSTATAITVTTEETDITRYDAEADGHGIRGNVIVAPNGDLLYVYKRDASRSVQWNRDAGSGWGSEQGLADPGATSLASSQGPYLIAVLDGGGLSGGDRIVAVSADSSDGVQVWQYTPTTTDLIEISGATQEEYNGVHAITVTTANAYTFIVSGSPTTPATGTIEATAILLKGWTDASGNISVLRSFDSNQPITGWVRKSSNAPYYSTGAIAGTIDSAAGLSITVQLATDG